MSEFVVGAKVWIEYRYWASQVGCFLTDGRSATILRKMRHKDEYLVKTYDPDTHLTVNVFVPAEDMELR